MSYTDRIRILIVDDHPLICHGLSSLIAQQEDMQAVGEARNGHEAVEMFRWHHPDIVLMDLRMPEMDGLDALRTIHNEATDARILVLSAFDADEDIYRCMQAGAKAYLLKSAPNEDLLRAIREVNAGQTHLPPEVASKLALRLTARELTMREMEVLNLLAMGKNNKEIGTDLYIAEGTVKAHVNSILAKLEASDRTQAVMKALKRGLVPLEPLLGTSDLYETTHRGEP